MVAANAHKGAFMNDVTQKGKGFTDNMTLVKVSDKHTLVDS